MKSLTDGTGGSWHTGRLGGRLWVFAALAVVLMTLINPASPARAVIGGPIVLMGINAEEGNEAAIAKYRELREQYYGGFSYDFGERSLMRLAERLLEQDKPDDAVAFLHLNLEMYPESCQTHVAFGQFYMQQEDNEQAIASREKAYELSPAPWIQQQLERLKSQ